MMKIDEILQTASKRTGVAPADLKHFFDQGDQRAYEANEWLFHESTPRKWAGLVLDGEVAEPIIAYDLLHGMMILKNACIILVSRCIVDIEANRDVCRQFVENSIGLVTALNPVLGYEKSAAIAKEALKTGGSVYDLVLQKGWLTKEKLDDMLKPENMTDPRQIPK